MVQALYRDHFRLRRSALPVRNKYVRTEGWSKRLPKAKIELPCYLPGIYRLCLASGMAIRTSRQSVRTAPAYRPILTVA